MKKKLLDKNSLQMGIISSSVYLTASVCPCCGKPSAGCLSGLAGAFFLGTGVWGFALLRKYFEKRRGEKKTEQGLRKNSAS